MDPACPMDFGILEDLKEQGYTDYTIRPLTSSSGHPMAVGLSTKSEAGFDDRDLERLDEVLAAFATVLELHEQRRTARLLLDTYVGPQAGSRILGGAIRRGFGEVIPAAIWYCDLRGFSSLSERESLDGVIGTLNDYFDHIAAAIDNHGGEILKFIGDGILAIFPIEDAAGGAKVAAAQALEAAEEALAELPSLNGRREAGGNSAIRYGIALHLGDVSYGNVGAQQRLDFTVIGPAVNLACRLEGLTRAVEPPIVLSSTMAKLVDHPVRSLGKHALKGISNSQEAFVPAECTQVCDPGELDLAGVTPQADEEAAQAP